ncbi:hypothetical protein [Cedecea neteri]|uniref:hypothetical protein n=1 Tax=Cedecea neteri TaxID=158822 RepID=UPI00289D9146|nr:hypothetical protein [Cedecea neteri]
MSIDLSIVSNDTELMAHSVILGGIIANSPKDKREAITTYALARLDERMEIERAKEEPNQDIITLLTDARSKAARLLGEE